MGSLVPRHTSISQICIYDSRDIKEEGWKDDQSKKTRKLSVKETETKQRKTTTKKQSLKKMAA